MVKRFKTWEVNKVFENGECAFTTHFKNFSVYKQPTKKSSQKKIKIIDLKKEMKKLKCESENNFLQKYFKFERYNGTYFVRKTNEYHENNKGKMIKKTFSQIIIGGETKRNDKIWVYKKK